jgi:hypothetical protein
MSFAQLTADEVAHALAEAKARGLPDGWDVKLDVRNPSSHFVVQLVAMAVVICHSLFVFASPVAVLNAVK